MTEKEFDEYQYCCIQEAKTCSGYERCGECVLQNMLIEADEVN